MTLSPSLAGVIFEQEADRIRLRVTARADLARSRVFQEGERLERAKRVSSRSGMPVTFQPSIFGVVQMPNKQAAWSMRRALERAFEARNGTIGAAEAADALYRCHRLGFPATGLENRETPPRFKGNQVLDEQYVPDPLVSRDQLLHLLETQPKRRRVGQLKAAVNLSGRIGGLARLKVKLTEPQKLGAAYFRDVAERAQLGAARAIDYETPRVDTSGATLAVAEVGADARAQYASARKALGDGADIVERIVVNGDTVSEVARSVWGSGGAARSKVTSIAVEGATTLAHHFGCVPGAKSRRRVRKWSDGSQSRIVREVDGDGV